MKKKCLLILCVCILSLVGCGQTAAPAAPAASTVVAEENKEKGQEETSEETVEENIEKLEDASAEEAQKETEETEEPTINGPDEMQKYLGITEEDLLAEFPDMTSEVIDNYTKYFKDGNTGNIIFRTKDGVVQNITMFSNEESDSADDLFGANLSMSMEELDERFSLYGYDQIEVELHKYKDDLLQFHRIYKSNDNDGIISTVYNGKTFDEIQGSSPVFIAYDTPVYADYLTYLTFIPAESFIKPTDEPVEKASAAEESQEAATWDPSKYDYVLNNINDEAVFGFNLADSQTFDGYMMTIGDSNFIAMLKDGQYTVFVEVGLPFDRMSAPLPYPEEDGNYKLEDYLEHYNMTVLWEKDVDTAYGKGKIVRVQETDSSVVYEKFYIQCNNSSVMMTWSRQSSDFGSEESVIEPVLDQMLTPKD